MILTSNPNVVDDPDYKTICKVIERVEKLGLVQRGATHCMSVCDILQKILSTYHIKSHLVEVKLIIMHKGTEKFYPLGFIEDGGKSNGVDTHVVLFTETNIPYIIDATIMARLPQPYRVVVDSADKDSQGYFNINHEACKLTYEERTDVKLPKLHQEYIIERMEFNKKIQDDISFLKKLNYIGITVSLFALLNVLLKAFEIW